MDNRLNLIALKPGDVVRMTDGAMVRIVQNPGDGLWIFGSYLEPGQEHSDDLPEEPIFAQEIDDIVSEAGFPQREGPQ